MDTTIDSVTINLDGFLAGSHRQAPTRTTTNIPSAETVSRGELRVIFFLGLVVLMSGVDLILTLHHAINGTMFEDNPLASFLLTQFGPAGLIVLKTVSVALTVGLLYRLRKHHQAELGAVICAVALGVVMVMWAQYPAFA